MHKVVEFFPLEMHFNDILLKVDPVQSKSAVLLMGDDVEHKVDTGVVVAVGPYVNKETTIKPGQRIRFRKFAGEVTEWDGIEYLIIMANDVRYTIHPTPNEDNGSTLRSV